MIEGSIPQGSQGVQHYHRLGGWLILVALYLMAELVVLGYLAYESFSILHTQLSVPEVYLSADVHFLVWFLQLIVTGTLVLAIVASTSLFLFFARSRLFPRLFMVFLGASAAFTLVASILVLYMPPPVSEPPYLSAWLQQFHTEPYKAIAALLILGAYITKSRRVRNVFVH